MPPYVKVAFFQKVWFIFQISKSPKKYSKNLSWAWNLNLPPITVKCFGRKFKFQVQDSFLEYFFGDLEIWKTNRALWKKNIFKVLLSQPIYFGSSQEIWFVFGWKLPNWIQGKNCWPFISNYTHFGPNDLFEAFWIRFWLINMGLYSVIFSDFVDCDSIHDITNICDIFFPTKVG